MDTNIIIHHVGGRNGSISFNFSKYFKDNFTVILYEPDKDALEQIKNYSKEYYGKYYVLPYCLDSALSNKTLNINRDPYTSSLLKQNKNFKDYYYFQNGIRNNYDYLWGEATETIIEYKVNTTTLDTILSTDTIPAPDIFCLDTQGSEHAILKGSEKALKKVIAIISEVEFSPLYENQSLFGDIYHFLQKFGFEFVYFDKLKEMSAMPGPISARGRGTHMFADALFIKKTEQIQLDFQNELEQKLAIIKLVFVLINLGHIENAIKLLSTTHALTAVNDDQDLLNIKYVKFCNDFYLSVCDENNHKNKIPTFSETFMFNESMNPNQDEYKSKTLLDDTKINAWVLVKNFIKKTPFILLLRFVRKKLGHLDEKIFLFKNQKNSKIEELLLNYGLSDIAHLVKENRLKCIFGLYKNKKATRI